MTSVYTVGSIESTTNIIDSTDPTKSIQFNLSGVSTGTSRVISVPNEDITLASSSGVETLTNKSLVDTTTFIINNSDNTKRIQFDLSNITTSTTRTLIPPNANDTLVGRDTTDTLTNKTLTLPVISTISNTGTLTLPTVTDTLVGRATTDTLTNKTLTSPTISGGTINNATVGATTAATGRFTTLATTNTTNQISLGTTNITTLNFPAPGGNVTITFPNTADTIVGRTTTDTLTNKTLTAPVISTIVNTGTLTLPTTTDTLVGRATTDTLTNKTLTSPTISGGTINNATVGATTAATGRFTTLATTNTTNQISLGTTNITTLNFPAPGGNVTITFPNTADTIVGRATTDTLTNKTLTAPVISTIVNTGTLTLPTTTDTLVGRATTDTLTNKTLTSPRIGTSILDTNGNALATLTAAGSAVNNLSISNAATGNNPLITAEGTDSNLGLSFQPKGTGSIRILGTATSAATLELYENTTNGTMFTALRSPATIASNNVFILPDTVGAAGQYLATNGSNPATFSWATPAGGGNVSGPGSATNRAIALFNGTSGTAIQNSGHTIGANGDVVLTGTASYLDFPDITAPANPAAGRGRLYKKTGTNGIFWLPDAAGAEVDLTVPRQITVTATATTTRVCSTTYQAFAVDFTTTPAAGTYYVSFSSSATSNTMTTIQTIAIAVAGTAVDHSARNFGGAATQTNNLLNTIHSQAICTVNGSQAINVVVRAASGTPTVTLRERSFTLIAVQP